MFLDPNSQSFLTAEIVKLKLTIQHMEPPSSRESIDASLSKEYDDFGEFGQHAQRELQRLNCRLLEIKSKVDSVGKAIEDLPESAKNISDLCVALFNEMGAHVSLQDIDIAHRVQSTNKIAGQNKSSVNVPYV